MTTLVDPNPPITVSVLERLEAEAAGIDKRQELVRFFCLQVIPFLGHSSALAPLLEDLRLQYDMLAVEASKHEKNAIAEIKKAFKKVEMDLKSSKTISEQLHLHLDKARMSIIKNRLPYITYPLFRVYDEEFRGLLQFLLSAGYRDICVKYAELIVVDEYIQKDPAEKEKWYRVDKEWKMEKLIPAEELTEEEKSNNPSVFCIAPEKILVKIPYIHFYKFAPSTSKAWNAIQQMHWNQHDNPVIVWHYFKLALWFWNTPRPTTVNKIPLPQTTKEALSFWQQSAEYSAWLEIASAKEGRPTDQVCIFSDKLFKKGLTTLINVIAGFLAKKEQQSPTTSSELEVVLRFFMNPGQFWISVDSV